MLNGTLRILGRRHQASARTLLLFTQVVRPLLIGVYGLALYFSCVALAQVFALPVGLALLVLMVLALDVTEEGKHRMRPLAPSWLRNLIFGTIMGSGLYLEAKAGLTGRAAYVGCIAALTIYSELRGYANSRPKGFPQTTRRLVELTRTTDIAFKEIHQ